MLTILLAGIAEPAREGGMKEAAGRTPLLTGDRSRKAGLARSLLRVDHAIATCAAQTPSVRKLLGLYGQSTSRRP